MSRSETKPRGRTAFFARMGCSLVLLACVLGRFDLVALAGVMARVSPLGVAAGGLALVASLATAGLVWFMMFPADHRPLSLLQAIRHTVVGASLSVVLPTSGIAGDVYRGWACLQSGGSPNLSAYVVVAARWCGLMALSCSLWIACAYLSWQQEFATLPLTRLSLFLAVGVSTLTVVLTLLLLAPGTRFLQFLSRRRVFGITLPEVSSFLAALVRRPGRVLLTVLVGIVGVYLEGSGIYLVACAAGASHHAVLFLLVGPAVRLIRQVPGFFNAIGVQEAAVLAAGDTMGVPVDMTLAISLLMHGVRLVIALLGWLWYVAGGRPTAGAEKDPGMA